MSDDPQKLRLRPRLGAGDQAASAIPIQANLDHGGAESLSRSDATPSDVAGAPLKLRRDLATDDALAGLPQRRGASAPQRTTAAPAPPLLAAPIPPSVQGAQRAVLMLGIAVIVILMAAGFLAYRLFVGASKEAAPANIVEALTPAANPPSPPLKVTSGESSGLPGNSGIPAPSSTVLIEPESASDKPARPPTENVPSAFRAWVENVKISGVRVSANPRILIGKVSFNQGDVVDEKLGIIFVGYDKERYLVRFQDPSGAILERQDRVLVPINAPPTSASRQPTR